MKSLFERRTFLKKMSRVFAAGILLIVFYFFHDLLNRFLKTDRKVNIPLQKITGNSYTGGHFFVFRQDDGWRVFSRKCPHLGCSLQKNPAGTQIVCPCHGSTFSLDGKYLHGPAKKDMTRLSYTVVQDKKMIIYF